VKNKKITPASPWAWISTLYLAEGLPYVAVMTISVVMYKRMGISNTDIALYTSWLYLPWVIKPFWSPFVDLLKTKRWWIVAMQMLIGAGLAGIAFMIQLPFFFQLTLAFFWLLAFSSATHDIAADGFYMLGLDANQQAKYVGIRSTFYRIATIVGQGALIVFAGFLERISGNIPFAWTITFFVLAGLFLAFGSYHKIILPNPASDKPRPDVPIKALLNEFGETFTSFFKKPHAITAIFFMLTYRFSEAQLLKLINPFLLDAKEIGGLGLTTEQVGIVYGTIGIIGLTLGGIIGGFAAARGGLKKWLWPMTFSMLLTIATFVYLSFSQTSNLLIINLCVFTEQFGYGFGFTAYMLYLIHYSEGTQKTAHYAICTGFMALGMMIPGMFAGWLQEMLGYKRFFIWVMISSILPLIAVARLKKCIFNLKTNAFKNNTIFLLIVAGVYLFLFVYSSQYCYFWDVMQQVAKEAYWYYKTNFSASLLIHPLPGLEITPTGYHPPLITIITAVLWKIFGYELWVSHAFTFCWAILLIYNSWKILSFLLPLQWRGWALLIMLLESTVVTQLVIASPDFILLTAFVISLRAIFQRNQVGLAIGLIFLCGVNMRGIFAAAMLFISHFYYDFYVINNKKYNIKKGWKLLLPYFPVFLFLLIYFLYYFSNNSWFFAGEEGAYSSHYILPENKMMIIKHLASFVIRLAENGRLLIWLLASYLIFIIVKNKIKLSGEEKMLGLFLALITGLYLLFVFITRMPFSSRYFMVHFYVLSLFVLRLLTQKWNDKKLKNTFIVILFFTITGHCWIYPEKIAQCWESTLLHTSYYDLRKECFDYIEDNQIDYNDISAGFCLSGNRGYIEMKHQGKIVKAPDLNVKYFIYSNISNLEDEWVDELKNTAHWLPVKNFKKGCIFITIYENRRGNYKLK
jgi:PAT family beta-lactamase induction signal transducer AmpG